MLSPTPTVGGALASESFCGGVGKREILRRGRSRAPLRFGENWDGGFGQQIRFLVIW